MRAPALLLLPLALACSSSPEPADEIETLVKLTHREFRSSTFHLDSQDESARAELVRRRPIEELMELYAVENPSVLALGGDRFADLLLAMGAETTDVFVAGLDRPDPRWRAFACEALGELGDPSAIPVLETRLEDDEVVPRYHGDPNVGVFAAYALAELGSEAGLGVLVDAAGRIDDWERGFLSSLRAASGKDFGSDLAAWQRYADARAER